MEKNEKDGLDLPDHGIETNNKFLNFFVSSPIGIWGFIVAAIAIGTLIPVAVYEKVEKVRKELGLRTLGSTILFLAEDYLFKNKN